MSNSGVRLPRQAIKNAATFSLLANKAIARPCAAVEMRAESGVDMTVKEQYLSPEEFQKAGSWLQVDACSK